MAGSSESPSALQIMSGEPKKDNLFHRRFVWMQFDHTHQRLYLIYFKRHGRDELGHSVHQPYFTAYQFIQGTAKMSEMMVNVVIFMCVFAYVQRSLFEVTNGVLCYCMFFFQIDILLDLPVPYMKDSTKSTYLKLGPYNSIPGMYTRIMYFDTCLTRFAVDTHNYIV